MIIISSRPRQISVNPTRCCLSFSMLIDNIGFQFSLWCRSINVVGLGYENLKPHKPHIACLVLTYPFRHYGALSFIARVT